MANWVKHLFLNRRISYKQYHCYHCYQIFFLQKLKIVLPFKNKNEANNCAFNIHLFAFNTEKFDVFLRKKYDSSHFCHNLWYEYMVIVLSYFSSLWSYFISTICTQVRPLSLMRGSSKKDFSNTDSEEQKERKF